MATSGYTDVQVTSWNTLRFSWQQTGQSIADNCTYISWKLTLISTNYGLISSSASKSWNVTVNGQYYEGTNTVGIGNNTSIVLASSGTNPVTIYHNADGTKQFSYSFNQYMGITFSNSWVGTVSGSGSAWLEPIPRQAYITSAPDFTDVDSPTVWFNNPAGSAVKVQLCISWTGGDDIAYRELDNYSHNYYTFDFTSDELNKLYAATLNGSNSRYVTFYVTTIIGTQYYYSTVQRLFTVTDCEPELDPNVVDGGSISTALTGNGDATLIRHYNYVTATFNAVAKKGASITRRTVTCGNKTFEPDGDCQIFDGAEDKTFTFTIWDNRGHKVEKTASFTTLIPYVPLTCNVTIDKNLASDNTANINVNISGNYFNGSFGTTSNSLIIMYRYKNKNSEYPDTWSPVRNRTISDNTYSATVTIPVDDYTDTYSIQVKAADQVYTGYVNAKDEIVKITPVFDWGEDDFAFNVPVTIQGKDVRTYSTDRIARAYTQEADIVYNQGEYIKLFRENSPTDLYNTSIATFEDNGLITIQKDMVALINIHILSHNGGGTVDGRSWIALWNYDTDWRITDCIQHGTHTSSQITTIVPLSKGTRLGIKALETMTLNANSPVGSYIEIMEL